jgi:response regulator RpfG family c-di-GMP phosphodiesterase
MNKSILLVDDEIKVLNSLSRLLSEENFDDVKIAHNAREALEIIKNTPDLALIVSDYRMPGMNGIEFLEKVAKDTPDITRILLTGAADFSMALDSINKGQIFRFLLKPCSSETFLAALQDGLRQNELILSERNLLNKTLSGSIKVMVDILAMLRPEIFVQAGRLRNLARDLAESLYLEVQSWELEVAAMLSQIGSVTIPSNILESWQKGEKLDDAEINMIQSIPRMGKVMINNIPRLQNIAEAVGYQNCPYDAPVESGLPSAENIPLMARVLKIIVDFDVQFQKSHNPISVFQNMFSRASEYDPRILPAFRLMVLRSLIQFSYPISVHTLLSQGPEYNPELWSEFRQVELQADDSQSIYQVTKASKGEKEMVVDAIRAGMVLSRDVCDKYGNLIVTKNTIVTEVLMYKLINYFHFQDISGPIFIESGP